MTAGDTAIGVALGVALILAGLGCQKPAEAPIVEAAPVAVPAQPSPVPVGPDASAAPSEPPGAAPDPRLGQRAAPVGFVDLRDALPEACFAVGYHTAENFTGAPLPGYLAPGAWLLDAPAAALGRVEARLRKAGWTVVIYDAYRPLRGTLAMVAWAKRTDQVGLLDTGYIARRSGHNHGHTVDLGLAAPGTCALPDMGTPWDTLDDRSRLKNATGEVLERRLLLAGAMRAEGFASYWKEWWHYQFRLDGTAGRDVPYGSGEPEEGAWAAPAGWERPGWTPPMTRRDPARGEHDDP